MTMSSSPSNTGVAQPPPSEPMAAKSSYGTLHCRDQILKWSEIALLVITALWICASIVFRMYSFRRQSQFAVTQSIPVTSTLNVFVEYPTELLLETYDTAGRPLTVWAEDQTSAAQTITITLSEGAGLLYADSQGTTITPQLLITSGNRPQSQRTVFVRLPPHNPYSSLIMNVVVQTESSGVKVALAPIRIWLESWVMWIGSTRQLGQILLVDASLPITVLLTLFTWIVDARRQAADAKAAAREKQENQFRNRLKLLAENSVADPYNCVTQSLQLYDEIYSQQMAPDINPDEVFEAEQSTIASNRIFRSKLLDQISRTDILEPSKRGEFANAIENCSRYFGLAQDTETGKVLKEISDCLVTRPLTSELATGLLNSCHKHFKAELTQMPSFCARLFRVVVDDGQRDIAKQKIVDFTAVYQHPWLLDIRPPVLQYSFSLSFALKPHLKLGSREIL